MTSTVSRLKRPDEDPVDWAYATGKLSAEAYRIVRPNGAATREVAAWAPPTVAPSPAATRPATSPRDAAYSANPCIDEAVVTSRNTFRAALVNGPAPTMFNGGDLPAATRSGLDPKELMRAPWMARHAIAEAKTLPEAVELLEMVSGPDGVDNAAMLELGHNPGVRDYQARFQHWLTEGARVQAAQDQERMANQMIAASAGQPMTVDEQVEALITGDELRAARKRWDEEQVILDGRSVGSGMSAQVIRASRAARGHTERP